MKFRHWTRQTCLPGKGYDHALLSLFPTDFEPSHNNPTVDVALLQSRCTRSHSCGCWLTRADWLLFYWLRNTDRWRPCGTVRPAPFPAPVAMWAYWAWTKRHTPLRNEVKVIFSNWHLSWKATLCMLCLLGVHSWKRAHWILRRVANTSYPLLIEFSRIFATVYITQAWLPSPVSSTEPCTYPECQQLTAYR